MTKTELLLDELKKENITVYDTINGGVPGHKAISLNINSPQIKAIILNNNLISSTAEKNIILSHEKLHFDFPSTFYSFGDCDKSILKKEKKVDIKLIKKLLPINTLADMIFNKHLTPWEIAEELELTDEFVTKAISYYQDLESWIKIKNTLYPQKI